MKNTIKKRAFVSAIAMLIVSAIVLTSSTFAWFSMSKEASVESMNLTVSSPEGIQISANASAWTASLTIDQIFNTDVNPEDRYNAYEGNNNLYPADLVPVSSAFETANTSTGYANFYKATLDDIGKATVTSVNQAKATQDAAGLIAFDLFFKVAEAQTVFFSDSEFTDNSGQKILTALRLAFVPMGTADVTAAPADVTALKNFTSANTIMYEVDSQNRSDDGAKNYGTGAQPTKYFNGTSANGSYAKTDGTLDYGTATISGTMLTDKSASSDKAFDLNKGITKMRVYIWVEGNDVDCLNSVAGAQLTANLKFTIA